MITWIAPKVASIAFTRMPTVSPGGVFDPGLLVEHPCAAGHAQRRVRRRMAGHQPVMQADPGQRDLAAPAGICVKTADIVSLRRRRLHVSRRTLYTALAAGDQGIAAQIRQQRLQRAHALLPDPASASPSPR